MHFGCHDIRRNMFATPVRGLVRSVLPLQHEIRMLQAATERCGNLATRLRVGPLCNTIQLSPLSGWPRRITDEPMMQVDSPMAANFTSGVDSCVGIVEPFKHEQSMNHISLKKYRPRHARFPCNRPPWNFGAWAASAHGRLAGTIR